MRRLLGTMAILGAVALPAQALAQDEASGPGLELLYRSVVTLSPAVEAGETPLGQRRFIPITGGTFEGPKMKGEILPMGWDWQLDTKDGCTHLTADYFLKTDDGVIINIVNTGAICGETPTRAAMPIRTSPVFEAPLGKYDWLNGGAYVGTLGFDQNEPQPSVIITVYKAN